MPTTRTIRSAAAARTRADGVHAVAAEVGFSPHELTAFLVGVIPTAATHARLEQWFEREAEQAEDAAAKSLKRINQRHRGESTYQPAQLTFSAEEFRGLFRSFTPRTL